MGGGRHCLGVSILSCSGEDIIARVSERDVKINMEILNAYISSWPIYKR